MTRCTRLNSKKRMQTNETDANETDAGSVASLRKGREHFDSTGRNDRGRVRDASVSSNAIVWDASGTRPRPFLPQGGSGRRKGVCPLDSENAGILHPNWILPADAWSKGATP
eukprot:gene19316-biopygen13011